MCENSREDGLRRSTGNAQLVITERKYGDPLDGIHTIGSRQGVIVKKIEDEPPQDSNDNKVVLGYN